MSSATRQPHVPLLAPLADCKESLTHDSRTAVSGDHSKEVMLTRQLLDRL